MRLEASLMLGWTVLLLWADRCCSCGPTWVLHGLLAVLFLYSYFGSLGASEELALPKNVDLGG